MNNRQREERANREAEIQFNRALHAESQADFNYYLAQGLRNQRQDAGAFWDRVEAEGGRPMLKW